MNQYYTENMERLRRKAEDILQIIDETYECSNAEKQNVLTPEVFGLELPEPLSFRDVYRLSNLGELKR